MSAVVVALGAGGIWAGVAVGASGGQAQSAASQATSSTATSTCLPGQSAAWCSSLPADKAQALSTYDAQTAAGASTPNVTSPPPVTTAAPPEIGIGDYGSPISPQIAAVNEQGYRRLSGGVMQLVMVGVSSADTSQGVVVVFTENWDSTIDDVDLADPNYSTQVYDSPSADGRLTITSAAGGLVQIVAADGTPFTFNLDTMSFQ